MIKIFLFAVLCYPVICYGDDTRLLFCEVVGLKYKMAAEMRDSNKSKNDAIIKLSKIIKQPISETKVIIDAVFDTLKTRSPEWISGFETGACLVNFSEESLVADNPKNKQT